MSKLKLFILYFVLQSVLHAGQARCENLIRDTNKILSVKLWQEHTRTSLWFPTMDNFSPLKDKAKVEEIIDVCTQSGQLQMYFYSGTNGAAPLRSCFTSLDGSGVVGFGCQKRAIAGKEVSVVK